MFVPSGDEEELTLHDLLNQCATNLTDKAEKSTLARAYEREQEIEQILTSLASPLKGRIVVTGEARVGKTAIIQEVAARIQVGKCPDILKGSEVWSLSARSILRAFGVRDWQDKLGRLMEKWVERSDIILCVDALPSTLMAGATIEDPFDMAQFLLGQLQSSDNRILAEGRTQAVHSFLEACPEYKHVLMEVRIAELPLEVAQKTVRRASQDLESSQDVTIEEDAIEAALDLTRRFSLHECLPGKAIDLISEGIALRSEKEAAEPRVNENDIITRFGEKTGLPRILLTDDAPYDEQAVRRDFSNQVLGQEQAVDVVVQALSLLRTRLNNPYRPMGVFLFIGPTGVGKTELARSLAQFLFGSDERIVRFNMADYTQEWHLTTLFGNPHGYDMESRRGQFTMRLQDHAFAVVLLDEFEKAHPEVYQRFLQLFDEGLLLNGASETVNLRNSIVIMTSNFGAEVLTSGKLGFGPTVSLEEQEKHIREEMVRFFTPEFINRIDSISFFKPLTKPVLREIAYRRVQEVLQREGLLRRRIDVEVDEDVIDWLVEHGYSERYGARYLARQVEKTITYPLARQLILNDPPEDSLLRLFIHNERVASALILPTTTHVAEDVAPAAALMDARQLPKRLTPDYIQAGVPLLRDRVEVLEAAHNVSAARMDLADLMQEMSMPAFWDDPENFRPKLESMSRLSGQVELVDGLRRNLDELTGFMSEMVESDRADILGEAALRYRYLVRELPRAELTLLFSNPWDTCGAYLHIEARGKRPAAHRWVADLGGMYLKWAERRRFSAAVISEELTDAGMTHGLWLGIDGYGVYGLLRGETGIHRMVQPDEGKDGKRQVVQALVSTWPDLPQSELPGYDRDLARIQTKEIKQPGVLCKQLTTQVDIQLGEKQPAMCLVSTLPVDDLVEEALTLLRVLTLFESQPSEPITNQIVRSYVRYKKRLVQDPRTGLKSGKLKAVLDGGLDPFLEAYLRQVAKNEL